MTLRRLSGSWRALFKNDACIAPASLIRVLVFSIVPLLAIVCALSLSCHIQQANFLISVSGIAYAGKTATQDAYLEIFLALSDFFSMHG